MKTTRTKKRAPEAIKYEPYSGCPFCRGRGCFGCKERKRQDEAAAIKAARDQQRLEDSLLFQAHLDSPEEMATLVEVFHADRLLEYFDDSDLTEEDVLRHLGKGDIEAGRLALELAVRVASTGLYPHFSPSGPFHPVPPQQTEDEVRQEAINRIKRRIASERGDARMREALRGKPGASKHL